MKLKVTIDMDNDAFVEDPMGELERILWTVRNKVERQLCRAEDCLCDAPEIDDKLLDINGNTIGKVVLST